MVKLILKEQNATWQPLLGGVGFASGVVYSFYKKTGFWKGWGIAIIGGLALGGIGYGLDQFKKS